MSQRASIDLVELHKLATSPEVRLGVQLASFKVALPLLLWRKKTKISIEGAEHVHQLLDQNRSFILAPNHQSTIDAAVLIHALGWEKLHNKLLCVGGKWIFENPLIGAYYSAMDTVPLDAGDFKVCLEKAVHVLSTTDPSDLKTCTRLRKTIQRLESAQNIPSDPTFDMISLRNRMRTENKSILIFPEGQRCFTNDFERFKLGIAWTAKETDAPVVPTLIQGAFECWPRDGEFEKGGHIRIIVGKPLEFSERNLERKNSREKMEAFMVRYASSMHQLRNSSRVSTTNTLSSPATQATHKNESAQVRVRG